MGYQGSQKTRLNQVSAFYFDTLCAISSPAPEPLLRQGLELCREFDAALSRFVPGSDVWRIDHGEGAPVAVGPHTLRILRAAQALSDASGGAFRVTLGEVTDLWKFTGPEHQIPDGGALERAVERSRCDIQIEGDRVRVPAGVRVDLGGIAKGYITDRVADFLRQHGVDSALLNFGGNIVALGGRPDGEPWRIGLQTPGGVWGRDYWAALRCRDETVVTSGVYERGFDRDGVRYHHILDPRTGWPVRTTLAAVTAVARDSMLADGLTTAMFVLGLPAGMELARQFGAKALFLDADGTATHSRELELELGIP